MNEKMSYAEMLEIPFSTCNVSYKQPKKRLFVKKKKAETDAKKELMDKINKEPSQPVFDAGQSVIQEKIEEIEAETADKKQNFVDDSENRGNDYSEGYGTSAVKTKKKRKFKLNIVAVQFALIGVLIAAILLTNALLPQSGINTLLTNAFGKEEQTVETDERVYSDFEAGLPLASASKIAVNDGVMTLGSAGSVYSPCDGTVSAATETDGKWTLEITHNANFKTVVAGLDYAYFLEGDGVFGNIPVGYTSGESASMCFYNGAGEVITEYTIGETAIQWAV